MLSLLRRRVCSQAGIKVKDAVFNASKTLENHGIKSSHLEASLLVSHVLSPASIPCSSLDSVLKAEVLMSDKEVQTLHSLISRRCQHEPVGYILGFKDFWRHTFLVNSHTLIPRPDSETLIEAVTDLYDKNKQLRILDLGTGSGCLVLSCLGEFLEARGVGVDICDGALDIARKNSHRVGVSNRVNFIVHDMRHPLSSEKLRNSRTDSNDEQSDGDGFDLILCNPPYIPADDHAVLEPTVRDFEPVSALVGPGTDGLGLYRVLAASTIPQLLVPGGTAVLEVGAGQAEDVCGIFCGSVTTDSSPDPENTAFELVEVRSDLAGIERCVVVRKKNS